MRFIGGIIGILLLLALLILSIFALSRCSAEDIEKMNELGKYLVLGLKGAK